MAIGGLSRWIVPVDCPGGLPRWIAPVDRLGESPPVDGRIGGNALANMHAMQMLRDLAQRSSDKAVENLGHLQRQQQEAQNQLGQLQRYRDEYQRKLHDSLTRGVSSSQWRDYQQFIASLDKAIEQQQRRLGEHQTRVENGKQHWQGERRKLNAYDTLHTRRNTEWKPCSAAPIRSSIR